MFPLVHDAPIRPPILPQSLSPPSMAKTGPASKNGKATPIFCFRQRVTITSGYGYRYINIPAAESPPAPPTFDSRWPWPVRHVRGAKRGQSPSRVLEQVDQGAAQGQAGWLWCPRRKMRPRPKPHLRASRREDKWGRSAGGRDGTPLAMPREEQGLHKRGHLLAHRESVPVPVLPVSIRRNIIPVP